MDSGVSQWVSIIFKYRCGWVCMWQAVLPPAAISWDSASHPPVLCRQRCCGDTSGTRGIRLQEPALSHLCCVCGS